jgi:ribonuclease D
MPLNSGDQPGSANRLTRDEINACPLVTWDGPIHVIRNQEELPGAIGQLALENLLGFDTETRPAFRKGESYPPSLLQLAGDRAVFIFQLQYLGLPEPLRQLLARPEIVKAGVAPAHDLRELQKLAPFQPAGFVDLGRLAKQAGIQNHGLRGLAAVMLGRRISKGVQTSNWAQANLTRQQLRYAATDAWLGRELYRRLQEINGGIAGQVSVAQPDGLSSPL